MSVAADPALIEKLRPAAAAEAQAIYAALVREELERLANGGGRPAELTCSRCGETKPRHEFPHGRRTCKACRRRYENERNARRHAQAPEEGAAPPLAPAG